MAGENNKDAAMAKYMKLHPGRYPDSIMRPRRTIPEAALARTMSRVENNGSHFDRAVYGGIMVQRLFGYSHGLGAFTE